MGRALPDVRDGLKPVHRRILHAMRELRLDPNGAYKKCARVVGDVIGKFHPHGDQAVYDALVRLAQDFAQRYPLVDGQGNFGNIDGDNAAAYRYTEARLSLTATACSRASTRTTVDFRASLQRRGHRAGRPARQFPEPAGQRLFRHRRGHGDQHSRRTTPTSSATPACTSSSIPDATIDKLVEFVPGPDFPTGGIIVEPRESILEAYKTGRGGFRLRARWEKEDTGRGTYQIVVTEMPYQVQKAQAGRARSPSSSTRRSCPCWATCATRAPRTCGWCSSPEPRRRSDRADGEPVQADRARDPLLRST